MPSVDQKTSTLFSIWVDEISTAYDTLEMELNAQIKSMKLLGLSDQEIFNRLSDSLDNQKDLFGTFKGSLGRGTDSMVNMISQIESNETIKDVAELFIWELDPTVEKHCETCLTNSTMGQMKFDAWYEIGLPGYGNTDCGKYCRCTLTPSV